MKKCANYRVNPFFQATKQQLSGENIKMRLYGFCCGVFRVFASVLFNFLCVWVSFWNASSNPFFVFLFFFFFFLVSSCVLAYCQPHRVTSGRTHTTLNHTLKRTISGNLLTAITTTSSRRSHANKSHVAGGGGGVRWGGVGVYHSCTKVRNCMI